MAKRHLKLVAPTTVNRTVTPKRPPNSKLRAREYLTAAEVERLMNAARKNRWGHRDATMILVAYRHGLRASELVDLHWDQVDFASGALHVRRLKQGVPSTHPIRGDELRALRRLKKEQSKSAFVFTSERDAPRSGFCPDDRTRGTGGQVRLQGASAHAQARMRIHVGEQGRRH